MSTLWSAIHNTGHYHVRPRVVSLSPSCARSRAMKENARQGCWNGALPPIGYRIVEAAEQRGHRVKKTLEIDPIQGETVRLMFRLAREGDGARRHPDRDGASCCWRPCSGCIPYCRRCSPTRPIRATDAETDRRWPDGPPAQRHAACRHGAVRPSRPAGPWRRRARPRPDAECGPPCAARTARSRSRSSPSWHRWSSA